MEFWRITLGAPTKIVAPMVDASELAWRLLSRKYGAQLCYTPMLHSSIFCRDSKYRKENLMSNDEDKPLIVQFCGNDPKVMLEAALLAEEHCIAIDINLGCPQAIAKRGNYGAFLQDNWDLIYEIVSTLSSNVKVPITCKIRVFEDLEKTVRYAKMLESAGCKMLTVHGRTREQKGPLTGLADWAYVKAVREAVNIPVISNGNIQCIQDVTRCLNETKACGVMTAEGNLHNPAIFMYAIFPVWIPALEYLELVDKYPCPFSYIRGHLFKLFHHILSIPENKHLQINLGAANTMNDFRKIVNIIIAIYKPFHEGRQIWTKTVEENSMNLILPPWICQPYIRSSPQEHLNKLKQCEKEAKTLEDLKKRHYEDAEGNPISRKKMKKLRRISRRPEKPENYQSFRSSEKCTTCLNPLGSKCAYKLCKQCCRSKCEQECIDCEGHRIFKKKNSHINQITTDFKNNVGEIYVR
ncbi:tRNA-dihydrouridine(16/17) synthase [NAD(P)(+)]-like [Agrilus planipennis]|uniref:tRNA-dihydrouridine(16/17) synthase [NAD(P)(+)] n=1 Tax=Agrilus planipennis TaxID=224129 RepID=A0A1W4WRQ0_AGRPL|nr:tRNA-dihydrouridine(16/17) synthase [NAD(P)(+)]-like [Agrilus planipennis]